MRNQKADPDSQSLLTRGHTFFFFFPGSKQCNLRGKKEIHTFPKGKEDGSGVRLH